MTTVTDIRPGDVLLFHGAGFISWAIRLFDGTEVNHAAIALPGGSLAEAGSKGLQERAIPTTFGDKEFMRIHRLTQDGGLDPVLGKAMNYLANKNLYAYQQIVLLAFLGLTRRIPLPRYARRLIRSAADHAALAVMDLLPLGAQWMICSEYVYRCYAEASDETPSPFSLAISGVSFDFGGGNETFLEWGLTNARDIPVLFGTSFGDDRDPGASSEAAIEADMAPLIADYAARLVEEGLADPADLPPLMVDPSFGGPLEDLPPEPTDEELLDSMTRFGDALGVNLGKPPEIDETFGGLTATISAAAVKGALQGIRNITVDPNFVTPGDLLNTPSLEYVGRIS